MQTCVCVSGCAQAKHPQQTEYISIKLWPHYAVIKAIWASRAYFANIHFISHSRYLTFYQYFSFTLSCFILFPVLTTTVVEPLLKLSSSHLLIFLSEPYTVYVVHMFCYLFRLERKTLDNSKILITMMCVSDKFVGKLIMKKKIDAIHH